MIMKVFSEVHEFTFNFLMLFPIILNMPVELGIDRADAFSHQLDIIPQSLDQDLQFTRHGGSSLMDITLNLFNLPVNSLISKNFNQNSNQGDPKVLSISFSERPE